jgi:hypothetical protein
VAIEISAQIGGQTVDIAAELEQRIVGGLPREGTDRGADRLRLCPASPARKGFEPLEIIVVEIDL